MTFEDMTAVELELCAKQTALEAHLELLWTAFFSIEDNPQEAAKKTVEAARNLIRQGDTPITSIEHQVVSESSESHFNEIFDKVLLRVETLE